MLSLKFVAISGALIVLFLNATLALADVSDESIGDLLVEKANIVSQKRECWFNAKHHYLVKFKDLMMKTLDEEFETLINGANAEASEACKQKLDIEDCENIEDMDEQAKCYIENSNRMAHIYRDIESCEKKILMPKQATLMDRLFTGVIGGWRQVHTTC
ncbi:uncharacterized protein [Musca autumnalis]|uniref:uncharacterized protein n=1 Tax=Musca autumnalis TaxID=221902 RepID=UPI003CF16841